MKRLSWLIFIIVALLVGVLVLKTIQHLKQTDQQKAQRFHQPLPVESMAAKVISLEEVIGASGATEQFTTLSLTAKIEARIIELPVMVGGTIKKGDLLVRWDDRIAQASVNSSRALVESCKIKVKNDSRQLERCKSLLAQHMGSELDLEQAETAFANSQQALAAAGLGLTRAEVDLEYTTARSPINGIVLERLVNPGETTKPDQELLKLGELDNVVMIPRVSEEKVGSVSLGLPAEVNFNAFPGEVFVGEVIKIDPKTDPITRSFGTYIKIPNESLRLKPGLTGFARIRKNKKALAVPSVAVMNPVGERATVFVVDTTNKAHLRQVRCGTLSGGMTEILDGLQEGDQVVTVGQLYLKDNAQVQTKKFAAKN